VWVIRVDFGMSGYVRLRGNLASTVFRFLPIEGIGLDVIQASKPKHRCGITDFEWAAIVHIARTWPSARPMARAASIT
jgi:hypothetical protein